jgi:hypothetical protein
MTECLERRALSMEKQRAIAAIDGVKNTFAEMTHGTPLSKPNPDYLSGHDQSRSWSVDGKKRTRRC